ncbi:MAG: NUDIX hydrolase N-terminal domain-containing protein [Akkermansia sp.]|nr:NUDIX hydrolase N-terminal domain-containing protein [Akkermansia sp.]
MPHNPLRPQWLEWAKELQFIAQAGIEYSRDPFDKERFERLRELSAAMLAHMSDTPLEKVRELFCNETGFQTPKLDSRAAIIRDGNILLVKELDGLWAMPGGWVDADQTIYSNLIKEAREEAGIAIAPGRLVALHELHRRNLNRPWPYNIIKAFVLCEPLSAPALPDNIETSAVGWFSPDALPPLHIGKQTAEQIRMCFNAHADANWVAEID